MAMPANPLDRLFEKYQNTDVPVVSVAAMVGGRVFTSSAGCTDRTLFQAASISKAVTALAALILVQEKKLVLDQDVNGQLAAWKLPPAKDTADPVTLRHLLCHGGGISVQSFPGYPKDVAILPNLRGILEGRNDTLNCPVRRKGKPGTEARYSGGGYTVLQQLIEEAAAVNKQTFAGLVKEKVFDPLGMATAGYVEPQPAEAAKGRAGGKEVPGGWRQYPELAAAGLWCTPTDLVHFAAGIQAAFAGTPKAVLSQQLAKDMLSVQVDDWGLGVQLPGNGYFRHPGQNEGYINELFATIGPGPAVAIMTASDHGSKEIHRLVPELCTRLLPGKPAYQASGDPDQIPPSFSNQAALDWAYAGTYETDNTHDVLSLNLRFNLSSSVLREPCCRCRTTPALVR